MNADRQSPPPAPTRTVGVLLMAYGGPDSLRDVEHYLADIRGGRPTSPELLAEITDRYRQIGGRSPILELTQRQAAGVERALNDAAAVTEGVRYRVYVGMRHWTPYIGEVVPSILADGAQQIVAVVMAPHFSSLSVGAYMAKARQAIEAAGSDVPLTQVESWKDEPAFIEAVSQRLRAGLEQFPADIRASVPVLFTAHSLPARILEANDPYPRELQESVRLVVERTQPATWRWAFQSQGATAEPWLGPTVEETLVELAAAGHQQVLLVPIGFVCDHVEVLFDVDIEHRQQAAELGMQLERVEMLNDAPGLIEAVASVVRRAASAPSVASGA